jgi:hypothetical protein
VERQEKQKVVQLSAVRQKCDLNQLTGEQFLKELVTIADSQEESAEYKTFLAALKALRETTGGNKLLMSVALDNTSQALMFNFKFE